jgi:hypothetical protein
MPRITLAHWYGDKPPGETIDVDEATAKALRRDGRVAAEEDTPQQAEAARAAEPQPEPAPDAAPAVGAEPAAQTGRRKR